VQHPPRLLALLAVYAAIWIGLIPLHSAWAATLLYHAVIVVALGPAELVSIARQARHGWRWRPGLLIGLAAAANGPLLCLLYPMLADPAMALTPPAGIPHAAIEIDLAARLASFGLQGAALWVFIPYYVLLHPILEEAFWRRPVHQARGRAVLTDCAFAGYHLLVLVHFVALPWALAITTLLAAVAWLWRRVWSLCEGPAIPLATHAVAGASTMAGVICLL